MIFEINGPETNHPPGRNGIIHAGFQSSSHQANTLTLISPSFCMTCQRSYWLCWINQLSGLPPKAFDGRIAIWGEIPNRPFNRADRVFLETPSPLAASVTVNPNGSKQSSLITSPGCGGLCTTIFFSLVVIIVININGVAVFKPEENTPITRDINCPETLTFSFQRMKP